MAEPAFGYLLDNGFLMSGDPLGNVGTPLTYLEFVTLSNSLDDNTPTPPDPSILAEAIARYNAMAAQYVSVGMDPLIMLGPSPDPEA